MFQMLIFADLEMEERGLAKITWLVYYYYYYLDGKPGPAPPKNESSNRDMFYI